jgi:predicted acetyltransferase
MPLKVKRVKSKQDIARAVDLAARVFSTYHVGVEQWTEMLRLDPGYAPGQTLAIEDHGEFVSQLRISMRHIRLGGEVGLLGGIGDVATHPAYQNQGYASACLEEATRVMDEAGCCVSALGAARVSFYRRAGWEIALPDYRLRIDPRKSPAEALDGYARRRFNLTTDLPDVMAVYDNHNSQRLFSAVRSEDYWRRQLEFNWKQPFGGPWGFIKEDPDGFWVITDSSDSVVAYARTRAAGDLRDVVEAAARDRRSALALLAHLAQEYSDRREIVLCEPPDGFLGEVALVDCGGTWTVSRSGIMVKIINLRRLFGLMAPMLGARLQRSELAKAAGALRLKTEIGSIALEWDRGEVAVSAARRGWPLELPHRNLAQVVTGYRAPASVLDELGRLSAMEPAQARALEVLFPRAFAYMNLPDSF